MAAIDLREILFKCHERGDSWVNTAYGTLASSTVGKISLSAVKYRAHEIGDDRD